MAKKKKEDTENNENQILKKRIKELETAMTVLKGEVYVWKSKFEASEREKDNVLKKKGTTPSYRY